MVFLLEILPAEEQSSRYVWAPPENSAVTSARNSLCSRCRRHLGSPEVQTAAKGLAPGRSREEAELRLQAAHPEITARASSPCLECLCQARGRRCPSEGHVDPNSTEGLRTPRPMCHSGLSYALQYIHHSYSRAPSWPQGLFVPRMQM